MSKEKLIKYLDTGILISLGVHVIASQYQIVLSSIGQGILIGLMIIRLSINRNVYTPEKFLIFVFLFFVFCELLSSAFSISPASSFVNSKRVLLFTGFFAVIIFVKDLKQLKYFLLCLFIFSALLSTYEFIRYLIEYPSHFNEPLVENRLQYFGYPITNGEIKMLILLLIIPFLFIKEDFVIKKYWLVIFIIPVFLTLFITSSRNALLGLFVGIIIISFLKNKKFLLVFLAAVVLFLIFAPMGLKDRILSIVDMNHPSNQSRFIMWQTGIRIIKDYFWLGIGDTDLLLIYKNYRIPQLHGEGVHLHNNFFQIFLTLGVVGFISYMLMMVYLIYRQIKIYIKTKENSILNILAVSSFACMIAFHVSGLTEWNFGDFEFAALLWFTLGLAFLSEKLYMQGADGKA